ncbi:MAG: NifU family protein [candidate division WOR-3 bacterium]
MNISLNLESLKKKFNLKALYLIMEKEGTLYLGVRGGSKDFEKFIYENWGDKVKIFKKPKEEINFVIGEKILGYIKGHGGDIGIEDIDEEKGVIYVDLKDACSCCPHSVYTLTSGIKRVLVQFIPWVKEVKPVNETREPQFNFKLVELIKQGGKK